MANYKTPGVYVEEISTLPPSVGQVPTAVPAFIGYTEKARKNGRDITLVPTHITSMLDYRDLFGGPSEITGVEVNLDVDNRGVLPNGVTITPKYYLYDSMRMFYANGGGECYIVSVGQYTDPADITMEALQKGIDVLYAEDHPTMLVMPDAMLLAKKGDAYTLQQSMLAQCNKMQDRVAILDVHKGDLSRKEADDDPVLDFRNGIGINFLNYGAAYYPWIQTAYSPDFGFDKVSYKDKGGNAVTLKNLMDDPTPITNLEQIIEDEKVVRQAMQDFFGNQNSINTEFQTLPAAATTDALKLTHWSDTIKTIVQRLFDLRDGNFTLPAVAPATTGTKVAIKNAEMMRELKAKTALGSPLSNQMQALMKILLDNKITGSIDAAKDFTEFQLDKVTASTGTAPAADVLFNKSKNGMKSILDAVVAIMDSVKTDAIKLRDNMDKGLYDNNAFYRSIVNEIQIEGGKLPPSGAIAGMYAQVDKNLGVWKAPANVSLAATTKPWVKIDDNEQEDLNVDVNAGKSINAIRAFNGKGTLVWGARTLEGNSNEWRYISVRRTFIMVEQSLKASTFWAVFEANNSMTWVKVKAMITNYLTNLWQQGALAGSTPDEAFFVNIGLGQTMTAVDIHEGRMNVEIGMAVVRPAEFIILKFSHKIQEP